jgi:hypothetical protein
MAGNVGTPSIPFDRLIFQLDVGSYKCILDSTDDISNGVRSIQTGSLVHGTGGTSDIDPNSSSTIQPQNTPTFNEEFGGVLDFNNADGNNKGLNITQEFALDRTEVISYSHWVRWPSTTYVNQYFMDTRHDGQLINHPGTAGNSMPWYFQNYAEHNVNWHSKLQYRFNEGGAFDETLWPTTEWVHLVVVSNDGGSSKIYINGSDRSAFAVNTTAIQGYFWRDTRIGTRFTTSGHFRGLMGPIHVYNKALTSKEARQLFDAYKGRFNAKSYEDLAAQEGW